MISSLALKMSIISIQARDDARQSLHLKTTSLCPRRFGRISSHALVPTVTFAAALDSSQAIGILPQATGFLPIHTYLSKVSKLTCSRGMSEVLQREVGFERAISGLESSPRDESVEGFQGHTHPLSKGIEG